MAIKVKNPARSKSSNTTPLYVGAHYDEGTLGSDLDPDKHLRFVSIFGDTYSVGNVMRFISYADSKPYWINSPIKGGDFANMRKGGAKQDVANYWNIMTLVIVDRLLSDTKLLSRVNDAYQGSAIDDVRVLPVLSIKRGVISKLTANSRLKVYGIILGVNLREIVNRYRKIFGEAFTSTDCDSENTKIVNREIREWVFGKVMANIKSDNVLDGIDANVSNDDLRKEFLR